MAPTDQKTITLPLNDFLDMQDKLANAMDTYRGIAMKILEASSNSLHITTDALTNLHSYTTTALSAADISPTNVSATSFPTIAQLLKNPKDKIRDYASLNLPHAGIGDKSKKSKAPRKPKDPDAPKRPDTAYLRFANQNREKYADVMKKEDPNVTRGAIAKKLTADWNAMDEKAQQPYKDSYRKEMAAYNIKKAEYEKRTGKKVDDKELDEDEETAAAAVSGLKEGADDSSASDADSTSDESDEDGAPEPTPKSGKGAKGKGAAKKDAAKSPPKKGAADAGKKKRKLADEEDGSKKRAKKGEADGEAGKKKKKDIKGSTPIDPRLEKIDKDSKRQKRKSQHGDDY